jgi:hypothetical protein
VPPAPVLSEPRLLPEARLVVLLGSSANVAEYDLPGSAADVVLRMSWFVPAPRGPVRHDRDVPLDPSGRRVTLPETPPDAVLRAALGVLADASFSPLAVAWVYRKVGRTLELSFAPPGVEPEALRERARENALVG